ncbi:MAG: hypothetical protein ACXWT1_05185 [Methylobacter sp.]
MIILMIKLLSFVLGTVFIMVSFKGFKLLLNGDLAFLGRGYKNKKSAEKGFYMNHSKMLKRSEGMVLNSSGKLLSNACVTDSEVYLRLKGQEKISN